MMTTMVQGVRPWDSVDSSGYFYEETRWVKSDFSSYDSQAQIELCLRCPIADECADCIDAPARQEKATKRKNTRTLRRLVSRSKTGR